MDLIQIGAEILHCAKRLQKAGNELYKMGEAKAKSEQIYRVKLSQEMLKLKSECMSIGMIGDVAKGNVAEYLFQRDYDEVRWKAAIESVDAIKCQLSAYQSLLKYQDVI
jgi:uncharacterized protein Yka (UPF0111/DUF47 family)